MNTFRLKRNLDETVYEQILSSIFEGKFHSGEQVQIERLCEQYEIAARRSSRPSSAWPRTASWRPPRPVSSFSPPRTNGVCGI